MPRLSDNQLACLRDCAKGSLARGSSGQAHRKYFGSDVWDQSTVDALIRRKLVTRNLLGRIVATPAGRAALKENNDAQ